MSLSYIIESQDPIKVDIQKAVLKSWSLLPKNIKLVLFTDSEYWNLDSSVARIKAYLGES